MTSPLAASGVALDVDELLALRHHLREASVRSASATALPGGFVSRRRGRGLETADIRQYAEGDDIRHIDRNATARTGIPHVCTFQDERDRTALLLADFRPAMHWGTCRALRSVAAAEALTLIGWRVVQAGGRCGLIAFGGPAPIYVPARGRERGMIAVAGAMAAAHRASLHAAAEGGPGAGGGSLDAVLDSAARLAPRGAEITLATSFDDPGEGFAASAGALMHRASLTVLLVRDAFETAPSPGAYPFETEAGSRDIAHLGADHAAPPDAAAERLDALAVPVLRIDTSEPPAALAARLGGRDGL